MTVDDSRELGELLHELDAEYGPVDTETRVRAENELDRVQDELPPHSAVNQCVLSTLK